MEQDELIRFVRWMREDDKAYNFLNYRVLKTDGKVASEKDIIQMFKDYEASPLHPRNYSSSNVYPESSYKD